MKTLIGIIAALLGIACAALLILRIWNIKIVEWIDVMRSGSTLLVLAVACLFLSVVYYAFFKGDKSYDGQKGNRAHPKKQV